MLRSTVLYHCRHASEPNMSLINSSSSQLDSLFIQVVVTFISEAAIIWVVEIICFHLIGWHVLGFVVCRKLDSSSNEVQPFIIGFEGVCVYDRVVRLVNKSRYNLLDI